MIFLLEWWAAGPESALAGRVLHLVRHVVHRAAPAGEEAMPTAGDFSQAPEAAPPARERTLTPAACKDGEKRGYFAPLPRSRT